MMNGFRICDALVFSVVRICLRRSTVLRTIIRPDKYPANYQICSDDYVSVSHLEIQGTWKLTELVQFNVDNADSRNVDLMVEVMSKGKRRGK